MRDESRRANRLAAWTLVVGLAGYVLFMFVGLLGLSPPKPVRPTIGIVGGGSGALAVLILLAIGWRARALWVHFFTAAWIIVGFALGAAALVGIWLALFGPAPPSLDAGELLLRNTPRPY